MGEATFARFNLIVPDRDLWKQFKLCCQVIDVTLNDRLVEMIKEAVNDTKPALSMQDRIQVQVNGKK